MWGVVRNLGVMSAVSAPGRADWHTAYHLHCEQLYVSNPASVVRSGTCMGMVAARIPSLSTLLLNVL